MWFFLVPSVGVLFFSRKWTSVVSLTMIFAAVIALWTPLHRYLLYPFSDSFRISYPLLLTVAFLVALALEYMHSGAQSRLAQSRIQMERLTMIDELTQVENRRCFDERIQEVWKMSARVQRPVSMLIVDIDHFKFYNDYYGHLEGDKVLYKVAQAIRSTVNRGTDLVARWGGEEFVVLLPLTNGKGACLVAQRLVGKITALGIEHVCTPLACKQLTVSVGIASIQPNNANHYEKLVRLADYSLYVAKRQGRNLVGPLEKE
jgi:diguanylate cyclase (GGDEF)-like protein